MSEKQCPHGHPINESTGMGVVIANYQPAAYVSRDMAIDAEDMSLEGSIYARADRTRATATRLSVD